MPNPNRKLNRENPSAIIRQIILLFSIGIIFNHKNVQFGISSNSFSFISSCVFYSPIGFEGILGFPLSLLCLYIRIGYNTQPQRSIPFNRDDAIDTSAKRRRPENKNCVPNNISHCDYSPKGHGSVRVCNKIRKCLKNPNKKKKRWTTANVRLPIDSYVTRRKRKNKTVRLFRIFLSTKK